MVGVLNEILFDSWEVIEKLRSKCLDMLLVSNENGFLYFFWFKV